MTNIPRADGDFDLWLGRFTRFCVTDGTSAGLSAGQIADIHSAYESWHDAYTEHLVKQKAARSEKARKTRERAAAEKMARRTMRIVQAHPEVTNSLREKAGISVPELPPKPQSEDIVLSTPPPVLRLDWSVRSQVTIHFGPNPSNRRKNGLPKGMRGCRIWFTIDQYNDYSTGEGFNWNLLADTTCSPYVHILTPKSPITIIYRAQYLDRKLRAGPYSAEARASVTM